MNCNNCKHVKNLYSCINELTIGEVEAEISVIVFFENMSTGKIIQVDAESNIQGNVIFSLPFDPLVGSTYKVWLSGTEPTNSYAPLTVLIDGIETTCFWLRFDRIYGSENVTVTGLDQTFELA